MNDNHTDPDRAQKWEEMSRLLDHLAARVGDMDDFLVRPHSSLAKDDTESHPHEVSQAVRHLINASVDQLHGVKTLVHDGHIQHLAVSSTQKTPPPGYGYSDHTTATSESNASCAGTLVTISISRSTSTPTTLCAAP